MEKPRHVETGKRLRSVGKMTDENKWVKIRERAGLIKSEAKRMMNRAMPETRDTI